MSEPEDRQDVSERFAKRFVALAGARAASQVVGAVSFFLLARMLAPSEFGVVATALAAFAVFAGLGDLGTTRSIVRFVAVEPASLWPVFVTALRLRIGGGIAVGLVATVAIAALHLRVDPVAIGLGALIALISGVTELAYAGLRSTGAVAFEAGFLVLERCAFLVLVLGLLAAGTGPYGVLLAYGVTNAATSMAAGAAVARHRAEPRHAVAQLLDREARATAVGFALVSTGPRVTALVLALVAPSRAVAAFAVAQRPIEAVSLFALSTIAPLFPVVRAQFARGDALRGYTSASAVLAAVATAIAPAVAWLLAEPQQAVGLLVGSGHYPGTVEAMRTLALSAFTWLIRGVAELVLLAQERASTFLVVTLMGLVVNVGVTLAVARYAGAVGAARALLVAELGMALAFLLLLRPLARDLLPRLASPAILLLITIFGIRAVGGGRTAVTLGVVGAASVAGALLGHRHVRELQVTAS